MLVAAQPAAPRCEAAGLHPIRPPRDARVHALALKAMRRSAQFTGDAEPWAGPRGSRSDVIVERVNIEPGGRAVVGSVGPPKGWGE